MVNLPSMPLTLQGQKKADIRADDGIFFPAYVPTEAQWEFAAIAQIGGKLHQTITAL